MHSALLKLPNKSNMSMCIVVEQIVLGHGVPCLTSKANVRGATGTTCEVCSVTLSCLKKCLFRLANHMLSSEEQNDMDLAKSPDDPSAELKCNGSGEEPFMIPAQS